MEENNSNVKSYEILFDAPNCSDREIKECFNSNFKDELQGLEIEKDILNTNLNPKMQNL